MINLTQINIQPLIDIYLYSNTPAYLYRKFKSHPIIFSLSRREDVNEMLSVIKTILIKDELILNDIVLCYALLVAILIHENPPINDSVNKINFEKLEWGKIIISIHNYTSSPLIHCEFGSIVIPQKYPTFSTDSSQSSFHLTIQPKTK